MKLPAVGVVTVGQTPRPDLELAFGQLLPGGVSIRGALDDVSEELIREMAPVTQDDYPIRCGLASGREVSVSKSRLLPLVQQCVDELAKEGVAIVVIGCNSTFEPIGAKVPVLSPGRIVNQMVYYLVGEGKLGCLVPLAPQVPVVAAELASKGVQGRVERAGPADGKAHVLELADQLHDDGCSLIFLRCFGFGRDWQRAVAERTGIPVISPVSVSASLVKAILG